MGERGFEDPVMTVRFRPPPWVCPRPFEGCPIKFIYNERRRIFRRPKMQRTNKQAGWSPSEGHSAAALGPLTEAIVRQ